MNKPRHTHPLEVWSQYFSYDPDSGKLTRIKGAIKSNGVSTSKCVGVPVTATDGHGYLRVSLHHQGSTQRAGVHQIAWLLYYGEWPSIMIDHINRDKKDNRISNLRDVTNSQNCINAARCDVSASKNMTGITERAMKGKSGSWYRIQIQRDGKVKQTNRRHLEDAIAIRDEWIA